MTRVDVDPDTGQNISHWMDEPVLMYHMYEGTIFFVILIVFLPREKYFC